MVCPKCKLINPNTAQRCDCGFDFVTKTVEKPYCAPEPQKKSNRGGLFVIFQRW
jgi:hypothetical protein